VALLGKLRVDRNKVQDGEWKSPGEEWEDMQLLVRGQTDQYRDAVAARMRAAARDYNDDTRRVPSKIARAIVVECLIEFVFIDVKNAELRKGEPIDAAQYIELMRSEDYPTLVDAVLVASGMVGRTRAADLEEAKGN